jgi:hypothetical protein
MVYLSASDRSEPGSRTTAGGSCCGEEFSFTLTSKPGFPFWLPVCDYYTPSRQLLILQSAVVLGEPSFGTAKRHFRPAEKSKAEKSRLFGAFHGHLAGPHLLVA